MKPKSEMVGRISIISVAVALALLVDESAVTNGSPEVQTVIYKFCSSAKVDVEANGVFRGSRVSLVEQLLPRSSHSKFYKSAVVPDEHVALWGHFQCRRDLSAHECHACVDAVSSNTTSWCANSLSGRLQLYGCHLQYEADGSEIQGAELTHNGCGEPDPDSGELGSAVEDALAALQSAVTESPNGYCSVDVGGVYAVAQCADGLSGCHCAQCVSKAAGMAIDTCAGSLSGHAYLDMCFVTFEFRPSDFNPGRRGRGIGSSGKLVAIAAGGVVLVSIAIILLKRSLKKDDDY